MAAEHEGERRPGVHGGGPASPADLQAHAVDLDALRTRVSDLLGDAAEGARSVDLAEGEGVVEVTDEQVEALGAAHDALAEALHSLDSGRS